MYQALNQPGNLLASLPCNLHLNQVLNHLVPQLANPRVNQVHNLLLSLLLNRLVSRLLSLRWCLLVNPLALLLHNLPLVPPASPQVCLPVNHLADQRLNLLLSLVNSLQVSRL